MDDPARDQVRTCVYYAFRRHGIEIPYPIQVHYRGADAPAGLASPDDRQAFIDAVDLFRRCPPTTAPASRRPRASGSTAPDRRSSGRATSGDSMFVIGRGSARVTIVPAQTEVATLAAGGYFGEMSLLTGQPRTATVSAIDDCLLLEISAADFRQIALAQPAVLEQVTAAVAERQAGLARSREVMAVERADGRCAAQLPAARQGVPEAVGRRPVRAGYRR